MDEREFYEYRFTEIDSDIDGIHCTLKKHEGRLDKHDDAIKESLVDRAKLNQSLSALTKVLWYLATAIVGLLIANIVQDFLMMK
ncbi:MAG: hypothetical protein ACOXZ0_06865 [Eubacteriales bacterium]|jgi:hypothetical protein